MAAGPAAVVQRLWEAVRPPASSSAPDAPPRPDPSRIGEPLAAGMDDLPVVTAGESVGLEPAPVLTSWPLRDGAPAPAPVPTPAPSLQRVEARSQSFAEMFSGRPPSPPASLEVPVALPPPTAPSSPWPTVQREPEGTSSAVEAAATASVQRVVDVPDLALPTEVPVQTQATASVAPAAGPGGPSPDVDELARRLYDPLAARLRAELWLDRERAGLVADSRML